MKGLFFLLCAFYANANPFYKKFENWATTFNIEFQDKTHFYDVFQKWSVNDKYIDYINNENLSYSLAHNQFSGMDEFDFIQYVIKNKDVFYKHAILDTEKEMDIPEEVDWVKMGAVTPVKDQGHCGSCWAFSATGALEGIYKITMGELVSFSEQQLIDCDIYNNHGCSGGLMDNAFKWISKNKGLCSDYPYISENGLSQSCNKTCINVKNSEIVSYNRVAESNNALMRAIYMQPVSVAIEADGRDFQLYKSGVFTGKCGTNIDHGVLAVGYGSQNGEDYYLIKNSWGVTWGDAGYIKLARGDKFNGCGILLQASYPILKY